MQTFGLKIVDLSPSEIEPLVTRALNDGRPIEIGLYFGNPEALGLLEERLPGGGIPVAVHLDHGRLSVFDLEHREDRLCEQLERAARLGATAVVDHFAVGPLTPRPERRQGLLERLARGVGILLRRCGDLGLSLHLENVHQDLSVYRGYLRDLGAAGLTGFGCCFDMGHAKIWSTATLGAWLDLLADCQAEGRRLHFHLHANRGLDDEHLSFPSAERLGICGPDGYTEGLDYYQALAAIAERFPGATKIFEVPSAEAELNLDRVLARIAALRETTAAA